MKSVPPHVKMWCFLKLFSTSSHSVSFNAYTSSALGRIYITSVDFVEGACEREASFKFWGWIAVQLKGVACDDIKPMAPSLMVSWRVMLDKTASSQR